MGQINLLAEEVINKIAAGEVIERPASVLKELVENSIDAESGAIEIEVINGGKRLIKVSDDGLGMDKADAQKCILRHATSKIITENNLTGLTTMGFRGEALAAIASVAKVQIVTAPRGSLEAVVLDVHGSVIKSEGITSSTGTSISVWDIFYNIPVRKKFLKATSTESYHIMDTVTHLSLANPNISFTVYVDKKEVMKLASANDVGERISQVFGYDFFKKLSLINEKRRGIEIHGFTSTEKYFKKTKSNQYLFLNKRVIKDSSLRHAIYQGYSSALTKDNHPQFFVYVTLDPSEVDFNVHPTKREVRFENKEVVYKALKAAVERAQRDSHITGEEFSVQFVQEESTVHRAGDETIENTDSAYENKMQPTRTTAYSPKSSYVDKAKPRYHLPKSKSHKTLSSYSPEDGLKTTNQSLPFNPVEKRRYIYVSDVFVVYGESGKLYLMDHHACHERVVYERLKGSEGKINQVSLLFPIQVNLSPREGEFITGNIEEFQTMGIDIDNFGGHTFIIRSLPKELDGVDMASLLSDICALMIDKTNKNAIEDIKDELSKRIACHNSVRGKHVLKDEEIDKLLWDLKQTKDPDHCPHGRPTIVTFSEGDLRKMFKRT